MAAQITQAEIDVLKSQFDSKMGNYSVTFKKDDKGREEFKVYKGESGEDALWVGSVLLEQDYFIDWEFSLKNGAKIKGATFKMNDNNKDIISNIYDMYQVWYTNLNKYIRTPEGEGAGESEVGGEEIVSGEESEETIAESRSLKGRKTLINSSSNRMKRLAGL